LQDIKSAEISQRVAHAVLQPTGRWPMSSESGMGQNAKNSQ
jgi:hypothetical protein